MPNIGILLKQEISRLCRREIRKETDSTKKASAVHRREIAALKRKVTALERKATHLTKLSAAQTKNMPTELPDRPIRFVARGFRAHRARLGLSAPQMGKLIGVSEQTIYNWETGHARPRKEQMPKIVALRSWGKREAQERLEAVSPGRQSGKRAAK
jgi:DNA-binding XRE family transcriptional regulator